jgi:hypothetical protein
VLAVVERHFQDFYATRRRPTRTRPDLRLGWPLWQLDQDRSPALGRCPNLSIGASIDKSAV